VYPIPAPFAWVEIPCKIGKKWKGAPYAIAKYPVTNAQFRLFVEAGGYEQRQWWTDAGWQQRQKNRWTEPRFWTDMKWNGLEQPVVGASWYESVAFCLWLSDATGEKIMLPTEEQWQYAAQGDDGRGYPWGKVWDCAKCNDSVKPCDSKGTTPVRQYEGKGDSFFGVVDMAGNVWEWCLTDYDNKTNDVNSLANSRVLRGGSWDFDRAGYFRCDNRGGYFPHNWSNSRGFRLALS
jgi:formylglycine-generating enzyme required for sulfatase activity